MTIAMDNDFDCKHCYNAIISNILYNCRLHWRYAYIIFSIIRNGSLQEVELFRK